LYLQGTSDCTLNEHYLHYLWRTKRLPFHQLRLSDGASFQLISSGTHNTFESGPDFSCALVKMNGIVWAGNVEIHLRSSDWFVHGHHHDPAYNNVILHVVLIHDKDVIVHGRVLPTLELKSCIDLSHLENQRFKGASKIPCSKSLRNASSVPFFNLVASTLSQRLQRKAHSQLASLDTMQWFYSLIACSFGAKVNDLPFEVLTHLVPWSTLNVLEKNDRFYQLLNASSLFPRLTHSIGENTASFIEPFWWKRKGQHAYSQPQKRVVQFAAFIAHLPDDFSFIHLNASDVVTFFTNLCHAACRDFGIVLDVKHSFVLRNLLINAVAPLFVHFGQVNKALFLIQSLSPENNYITRQFKAVGISPRNAAESQMLIEVYSQFCAAKKCLNCAVGMHILAS
jgi:hypothetical protein